MIEFRLFIPTASNEGVSFNPEHHGRFEAEMLRLFGGFSLLRGIVSGQWLGKDITYADDSRVYVVAVGSIFDAGRIREVAEFALGLYGQESIYVGYLGFSELVTK
jgi:hypothetical protein